MLNSTGREPVQDRRNPDELNRQPHMQEGGRMFANVREDWRTYDGSLRYQGLWVMLVYRFGRWRYRVRPALLRKPFSLMYKFMRLAIQTVTGIDLPCEVQVGRRLRIVHFGGIIINRGTVIGDDVILRHGVTLGMNRACERGAPRIGNRVDIGVGAKILGPVSVGDDAVIGVNAVVLRDVPPGTIALGIPARILPLRRDSERDWSVFPARPDPAGDPLKHPGSQMPCCAMQKID